MSETQDKLQRSCEKTSKKLSAAGDLLSDGMPPVRGIESNQNGDR